MSREELVSFPQSIFTTSFADYYLLHPSLQPYCATQGAGKAYRLFRYIVVGHDYPWHSFYPALVSLQLAMMECANERVVQQVDRYIQFCFSQRPEFEIEIPDNSPSKEDVLSEAERIDESLWLSLDEFCTAMKAVE